MQDATSGLAHPLLGTHAHGDDCWPDEAAYKAPALNPAASAFFEEEELWLLEEEGEDSCWEPGQWGGTEGGEVASGHQRNGGVNAGMTRQGR
eukprot:scaffold254375_cov19-Tisochrysis_lutea.AAC.1